MAGDRATRAATSTCPSRPTSTRRRFAGAVLALALFAAVPAFGSAALAASPPPPHPSSFPHLDEVIAVLTAERPAPDQAGGSESFCAGVAQSASDLVAAEPQRAPEISAGISASFPECDKPLDAALQETLSASSPAGGGNPSLSQFLKFPANGIGGGGASKCKSGCLPIEAPQGNTASRTTF